MPGTQPNQVVGLDDPANCSSCHGYYDPSSPFDSWQGSMMSHASRDPLFWGAMAVAEQDYDGSGDLCLRCHTPAGWLAGESTPTDGSAIGANHENGVECALCHRMADPDGQGLAGVQQPPFLANTGGSAPEGFYGNGMYVVNATGTRYGPYQYTTAPHATQQSTFHRESALCGTCHDVSNPVVGDLAHNNGSMTPLAPGQFSGVPGSPVGTQAAFLNQPHAYGVVERTYSEHLASGLDDFLVSDYDLLPAELKGGVLLDARDAALLAGNGGDYADGTPRAYTCQTCHMQPAEMKGCGLASAAVRSDMPVHDLTGGNTWAAKAILWLDARGRLKLGGGIDSITEQLMLNGIDRARLMLKGAADLRIQQQPSGALRVGVINRTGHKLFTGYPEGRRMWVNLRWYDVNGTLLREDGEYGALTASWNGHTVNVKTLLDPADPDTRVYEVKPGITQEWASQLLGVGADPNTPLLYDRVDSSPGMTLGQLAALPPGSAHESFHFVWNNKVLQDNRIPPWGFDYDMALERNALPVPDTQYGDPGPGGVFRHYDVFDSVPPAGARGVRVRLMYQTTSWEYVQFLFLANKRQNPFLADVGVDLLEAWFRTGMAEPEVMAQRDLLLQ